ncbi:MAG: hypothetical protein JNL74_08240, partial [Fibrobacteres bacterium]|nr:hypothetical protein [Fibrobacterota bacterium]
GCRTEKGTKWGMNRFYNTGLFYGRWLFNGIPFVFFKAMKDEIEFLTRNGSRRKWLSVFLFFASLIYGFAAGIITKKRVPAN